MATFKLLCLSLLLTCLEASFLETSSRSDDRFRLPTGVINVLRYDLNISLLENVFTTNVFNGELNIYFTVLNSTNEIQLHTSGITISSASLTPQVAITNTNFDSDADTEILTLTTATALTSDTDYVLHFVYTAQIRTDEMYGFYRSNYTDVNGDPKYLATTQFQPTFARRAFPCFDEPAFKAIFYITIRHPNQYSAFGNTPIIVKSVDESDSNYNFTTFAPTPKMSSYLIAFIISEFTCDAGEDIDENIPYHICSRAEAASTRNLAVEKGPPLMWAMEQLTGVKYSVGTILKMDQFAIPDFAAGAMENWGLATYRENALLWDEAESSNRYKQRIETVISHEFAHMWFGNLVTTHWWSDTFLNEGFARYYEYFATAVVEPSWELDKQFVLEQIHSVMVSDASPSVAALSSAASSPAEVLGRFVTISYNKGGAVLRMLEYFMGSDNFKAGLNSYLTSFQFANTQPQHLWSSLQTFAADSLPTNYALAEVMNEWIVKPGFPILQVCLNGQTVTVSQQRFLASDDDSNDKWFVPITYTISDEANKFQNTTTKVWLRPNDPDNITLTTLPSSTSWIILNNQQIGYYRVNYDDALWDRISAALQKPGFDGIGEINRAQLIDDLFNLARTGKESYSKFLNFVTFLNRDTAYPSWYAAFSAFNNMLIRTANDQTRSFLQAYILTLMDNLYNSVPFNEPRDFNQIYTHNRVQTQTWACRLGLDKCIQNSLTAFRAFRHDNISVEKNMRSVVYCYALRYSDDVVNDFNFLWNRFSSIKLSSEENTILQALGCAGDETVVKNYLARSIDPNSGIRTQDALSVFSSVYTENPDGVDIALDFLLENHVAIANFYTSMNSLHNLVTGLANRFTKQEQLDKLSNFFNNTQDLPETLTNAAEAALSTARNNLVLIADFERELMLYFNRSASASLKASWIAIIGAALAVFILFVH